jgi:hypothetical protein
MTVLTVAASLAMLTAVIHGDLASPASWPTDSYAREINAGPYDLASAVPEASAYALAGVGLLVLCILLRRKLRLPPRR